MLMLFLFSVTFLSSVVMFCVWFSVAILNLVVIVLFFVALYLCL